MLLAPHRKLVRYWKDTSADVRTGPPNEAAVIALEYKYAVRLPPGFREYLVQSPPDEDQLDENCTGWWSLSRIKNIPDEYEYSFISANVVANAENYLFFADYMIWCWAWAICCQPDDNFGRVRVIGGDNDRFVADSFGEFVDIYIRDHTELL